MSETQSNIDKYYSCWFHLDGRAGYFIWYSGVDSSWDDGVVLEEDGNVLVFPSNDVLFAYANEAGISVEPDEPVLHDIETVAQWLGTHDPLRIDCSAFVAAWNLFGDVARTVEEDFDSDIDASNPVYDKLFWGMNLPPMTPPGEHFEPIWTEEQVVQIDSILSVGLEIFRKHLAFVQ